MEHHTTTSRAEAERLLGIAEKLLSQKDLSGSRDFAILAQETEPLLDGSDQILAVAEVLIAADSKLANNQHDWYAILQIPHRTTDSELIKKQYRRLALLLHPDKNKFAFADSAFRLVADAWAVLNDPGRKSAYDAETAPKYAKVDLSRKQPQPFANSNQKLPVRRSGGRKNSAAGAQAQAAAPPPPPPVQEDFWTACPYCHNLYEYPRVYENCCLRCSNEKCRRAFTGTEILSMPPLVPGREAYYCCWGVFPMGFSEEQGGGGGNGNVFSKWAPPMFEKGAAAAAMPEQADATPAQNGSAPAAAPAPAPVPVPAPAPAPAPVPVQVTPVQAHGVAQPRKRGRPRKSM